MCANPNPSLVKHFSSSFSHHHHPHNNIKNQNSESKTGPAMNGVRELCNHHPGQLVVGVCPFCLNQKLLAVAVARQDGRHRHPEELAHPTHSRKPSNGGLLSLGSILSRLELRRSHRQKSCDLDNDCGGSDSQSTSSSLGDSFISIKFEEDGEVSWDKSKDTNKAGLREGSLRWRKRIGHLLQLVRGKRLKKSTNGGHM